MKIARFIFLIFLSLNVFSQNEFTKWYFGLHAGLDFMTTPPSVITHTTLYTFEGSASVADASGNLLFYTDGSTIWNKQQLVMSNGTGLLGNGSTVQAALIVKKPGQTNLYYVFTLDLQGMSNGLRYSEVDLSLSAGMGSVTAKNIPLHTPCTEHLNAVRHCNGIDTWVMAHDFSSNNFLAYLVTASGVSASPVVSSIGLAPTVLGQGTIKFSPNGRKLGMTGFNYIPRTVEIFDFNNSTGVLSNSLSLVSTTVMSLNPYGCEFSPDGTKFYAKGEVSQINQWNLCAGSNSAIINSKTAIHTSTFVGGGQMQLAPDGKIYVTQTGPQLLSTINTPNQSGLACNFVLNSISVATGSCGTGLPNFISGSFKILPQFTFTVDPLSCSNVSFTAPPSAIINSNCYASDFSVTSVSWDFGQPSTGSLNTSTLSNPTHNYGTAGTYQIKFIYHYSCGADTLYKTLTFGPTAAISTSSVKCHGANTATAAVSLTPGLGSTSIYSYTWNTSVHTATVGGLSAGINTLQVKDGGCVITKTFQVAQPPALSLTINNTFTQQCAYSNFTLQASSSGGTGANSISWQAGPPNASVVVTQTNPGVTKYFVQVTDQNSCVKKDSVSILVLLNPKPAVSNMTICEKSSANIQLNSAPNYTWEPGGTNNSSLSVSPTVTTTYSVTTSQLNGCQNSTSFTVFVSKCLSISGENNSTPVDFYPSPVSDLLNIHTAEHLSYTIFSSNGSLVMNGTIPQGKHSIRFREMEAGIYLIKYKGKRCEGSQRVIKSGD